MLQLFLLDRKVADQHSDKFGLGEHEMIEWYKTAAKRYSFSNAFCQKVFMGDRKISQILTGQILDYNLLGRSDTGDFVYFYLSSYFANSMLNELDTGNIGPANQEDMDAFRAALAEIKHYRSTCMIEYSKKDGWFDYDGILKQRI
jgi:hypothetical protein